MSTFCCIPNCFNAVVAKDMCETHYRRTLRHGSPDQTRPNDWGLKEKHPLIDSWRWMKKTQTSHQIYEGWLDFWKFVEDIGERPSSQHRLHKLVPELGYQPGNLVWKGVNGSTKDAKEYARNWRRNNPDKAKSSDLKKVYGISIEQYHAMLKDQKYCCAICKKTAEEEIRSLNVDHCHTTGKVRGLLCSSCNKALGSFKDSKDILNSAIVYLDNPTKVLDSF